ncbi:unnamed protein product [Amoebophrya sp. A120]|nr:unnamed protein product [Amoebophrya sp. A120]|eukprot:GSA120T00004029001.1
MVSLSNQETMSMQGFSTFSSKTVRTAKKGSSKSPWVCFGGVVSSIFTISCSLSLISVVRSAAPRSKTNSQVEVDAPVSSILARQETRRESKTAPDASTNEWAPWSAEGGTGTSGVAVASVDGGGSQITGRWCQQQMLEALGSSPETSYVCAAQNEFPFEQQQQDFHGPPFPDGSSNIMDYCGAHYVSAQGFVPCSAYDEAPGHEFARCTSCTSMPLPAVCGGFMTGVPHGDAPIGYVALPVVIPFPVEGGAGVDPVCGVLPPWGCHPHVVAPTALYHDQYQLAPETAAKMEGQEAVATADARPFGAAASATTPGVRTKADFHEYDLGDIRTDSERGDEMETVVPPGASSLGSSGGAASSSLGTWECTTSSRKWSEDLDEDTALCSCEYSSSRAPRREGSDDEGKSEKEGQASSHGRRTRLGIQQGKDRSPNPGKKKKEKKMKGSPATWNKDSDRHERSARALQAFQKCMQEKEERQRLVIMSERLQEEQETRERLARERDQEWDRALNLPGAKQLPRNKAQIDKETTEDGEAGEVRNCAIARRGQRVPAGGVSKLSRHPNERFATAIFAQQTFFVHTNRWYLLQRQENAITSIFGGELDINLPDSEEAAFDRSYDSHLLNKLNSFASHSADHVQTLSNWWKRSSEEGMGLDPKDGSLEIVLGRRGERISKGLHRFVVQFKDDVGRREQKRRNSSLRRTKHSVYFGPPDGSDSVGVSFGPYLEEQLKIAKRHKDVPPDPTTGAAPSKETEQVEAQQQQMRMHLNSKIKSKVKASETNAAIKFKAEADEAEKNLTPTVLFSRTGEVVSNLSPKTKLRMIRNISHLREIRAAEKHEDTVREKSRRHLLQSEKLSRGSKLAALESPAFSSKPESHHAEVSDQERDDEAENGESIGEYRDPYRYSDFYFVEIDMQRRYVKFAQTSQPPFVFQDTPAKLWRNYDSPPWSGVFRIRTPTEYTYIGFGEDQLNLPSVALTASLVITLANESTAARVLAYEKVRED